MIILDTNVISETQARAPEARVMEWLNGQERHKLFITTVTVGELRYGVESLPHGRRRQALTDALLRTIDKTFEGRILDYTRLSADRYGAAMAEARRHGLSVSVPDAIIAGIALTHDFSVATRDTSPFLAMGVRTVVDPWSGTTWQRLDDDSAQPTHGLHAYRSI